MQDDMLFRITVGAPFLLLQCLLIVPTLLLSAPATESRHADQAMGRKWHFEETKDAGEPDLQFVGFLNDTRGIRRVEVRSRAICNPASGHCVEFVGGGVTGFRAVEPVEPTGGISNYLIGNDRSRWRKNVSHYRKVRLPEVYEGVAVEVYGNEATLEFDFVLQPGADWRQIRMRIPSTQRLALDPSGGVEFGDSRQTHRMKAPRAFQWNVQGRREPVEAAFELIGNEVRLRCGSYDPTRSLIVDPELVFSTYLGSSGSDEARALAVNNDGTVVVVANPSFTDFPTTTGVLKPRPQIGGSEIAISKISSDGKTLIFSTFFGGDEEDRANAVALDESGNIIVAGHTYSSDFPSTVRLEGGGPGYVAKISSDGRELLFSSRLPIEVALMASQPGGSIVVGATIFDRKLAISPDSIFSDPEKHPSYLSRISADGTQIEYATRWPGHLDRNTLLTIDKEGSLYLAGSTSDPNYPVTTGALGVLPSRSDAFLTKIRFNEASASIEYSTLLGGSRDDLATAVAVDDEGSVLLAGSTDSPDFPYTPGAFGTPVDGVGATLGGFVAKFRNYGTDVEYIAWVGDSSRSTIQAIVPDRVAGVWLCGTTGFGTGGAGTFPATADAFDTSADGQTEAYVAKLSADGSELSYSTLLGGRQRDRALHLALAGDSSLIVLGETESSDFPASPGSYSRTLRGRSDLFIAKFSTETSDCSFTVSPLSVRGRGSNPIFQEEFTLEIEGPSNCSWRAWPVSPYNLSVAGTNSGRGSGPVRIRAQPQEDPAEALMLFAGSRSVPVLVLSRPESSPSISRNGAYSGGASWPRLRAVSPGSILVIEGDNFLASEQPRIVGQDDLVNGRLPEKFAGVSVGSLSSSVHPILAVTKTRIIAQVPAVRPGSIRNVAVSIDPFGSARSEFRGSAALAILPISPELLYHPSEANDGRLPVAAFRGFSQDQVGPDSPVSPGDRITILCIGLGPTFPVLQPGEFPSRPVQVAGEIKVKLGDQSLPRSSVLFAGMRPDSPPARIAGISVPNVGIYQLDLLIPEDLPPGDHSIEIEVDGYRSPSRGYLSVR